MPLRKKLLPNGVVPKPNTIKKTSEAPEMQSNTYSMLIVPQSCARHLCRVLVKRVENDLP